MHTFRKLCGTTSEILKYLSSFNDDLLGRKRRVPGAGMSCQNHMQISPVESPEDYPLGTKNPQTCQHKKWPPAKANVG